MKITVLGAGAWGTAFGQVLCDAGADVTMWAIESEIVDDINNNRCNSARLPIVPQLPRTMHATLDRAEAVEGAEIVVVAIAAQFARVALEEFKDLIPPSVYVLSLMKGIEKGSGKRMDEVVCETLGISHNRFVVASGPNLSLQVAQRQPTTIVVGSSQQKAAEFVAQACHTPYFKPYISSDVIGLELCGPLKNVTSLAVGMSHGAGYGENTASVLMTLGLQEMARVGVALGAQLETFFGMAGLGDLIATASSPLSRNYTFGFNLGKGMSFEEATKASDGVAEGVATTSAVLTLARQMDIKVPFAQTMNHVLEDHWNFQQFFEEVVGSQISRENPFG